MTGPDEDRPKTRFGFFGQLTPYKGIDVLLEAMQVLLDDERMPALAAPIERERAMGAREHQARLWVHGANLDLQPGSFQHRFNALIEATSDTVTLVGRYGHADLPRLMGNVDWVVVPSVWWENSPLVIQEAFAHGRPVICSDIGGMAEKVTHDVNGLHFGVGDPASLARTIRNAVETPGLWERLRRGIPAVYAMGEHAARLSSIYRRLADQKTHRRVGHAS
jgi:glycosyltransferase involved in cell wall biosynthesis